MNSHKGMRLFTLLTLMAMLVGGLPAPTAAQAADPAWYLRGSFNGWDTSNPMVDDGTNGDVNAGDGIYSAVIAPAAGRYEFKVATQDWSTNYPSENSWLQAPGGQDVLVTFDTNTYLDGWLPADHIIGVSAVPAGWTAVGDWQGWNPASPDTAMTAQGGGLFALTTTIPAPGDYQFKAVHTGSWDAIGADGRSINAATMVFSTQVAGQSVTLQVNPSAGRVRVEVHPAETVPALDDNIWWDGVAHDSRDDLFRVPGGAVTAGTPVTLRLRTYRGDVSTVTLRVWNTALGAQSLLPMQRVASTGEPPYGYDYWEVTLPGQATLTTLWYRFIVRDGSDEDYYEDDGLLDGGLGSVYEDSLDRSFQINVYDPAFDTPDWMKNAVVYQIFPDRFFNGKTSNDPKTSDPTVYGSPVVVKGWNDLPEGYCRGYQNPSQPCMEGPMGRDFFGGDLKGIRDKLGYLKSLGVTAIYLNPIFKAPSNHLYDTSDYYQIDPYFGSIGDYASLVDNARALGITLILDGVFNHTSSDSLYFDRESRYKSLGAYESQRSPYYNWYTFLSWPNHYISWWGFDSLPVLTEIQPVRDFIYGLQNSVARYWVRLGSGGWRLDVAPDKSHDWWQEFRPAVKSANPEAVIVGEIWDDASPWLLGDQFDSTMNYRFRRALLGFLNGTHSDPNQGTIIGLNPDQFSSALLAIQEDYPEPAFQAAMNLVGSHDTQRILWSLTPGERNREDKEFNAANLAEGKARLKLLAILQLTMPGAPTIYYGDEAGLTGDSDPDDRRAFPWNSIDTGMLSHYQALTGLRSQNSFLRTGSFDRLYTHNDDNTYAYGRKDASGAAVVAVNNAAVPRTLVIDLGGYIPEGTLLADGLNGGSLPVLAGKVTVNLPARWGAVLITPPGTDLVGPDAPQGLAAAEAGGRVDLSWQPVNGSAGYFVYRSFVSGGGYTRLNGSPLADTAFVDSAVTNGQRYYYVVTAVDEYGNESGRSNQAAALPHLLIGWSNLQWPPSITHTLSAINRTENIYGQVWIDQHTSQPGPTAGLLAQVGYGPDGSQPEDNPAWVWVDAVFNLDAGNNDEFMGSLLPEAAGAYDYAYRYSTTAGLDWLYADLDGSNNGYSPAQAGALTVLPSGDSTPPSAPTQLRVEEASSSFIRLAWEPAPESDVFGYEVLRGSSAGGPYEKIARVSASEYTDWAVENGQTYYYVLVALDTSFNRSAYSSEVSAVAQPRQVQVTFTVTVPAWTPPADTVYIAGSFQGWNPGSTPMTRVDDTRWAITLAIAEGQQIEYKYTRGSWETVEKGGSCEELDNRTLTVLYGAAGSQTVNDTVANWRNTGGCGD